MRIKSFKALRPSAEMAHQVASVPYDTVDSAEAAKLADGNPLSFLHIIRPEIDLPDNVDIHSDQVYAKAAQNLADFRQKKILSQEDESSLYVYRQKMGDHVQTGLVTCCHVDDYRRNVIRKHEKTRQDKEDDRTRNILSLGAHSGPVFFTYKKDDVIDSLISSCVNETPLFDFTAPDNIQHTVWRIAECDELVSAFSDIAVCYIADGHHRAASALRVADKLGGNNDDAEHNWFEAVLFPSDQVLIMPYNRCVHDLNGISAEELIAATKESFCVTEDADPVPGDVGCISMYLAGKWYGLTRRNNVADDPVASLDVSTLQDLLLGPVLGIDDPRTSSRIDFVGGIRGTDDLCARVDSGRAAVAFSLYPVTVDQIMSIADAGMIMPPKSTWFEPKLRSGLLVHLF